jgi:hypothetical protein
MSEESRAKYLELVRRARKLLVWAANKPGEWGEGGFWKPRQGYEAEYAETNASISKICRETDVGSDPAVADDFSGIMYPTKGERDACGPQVRGAVMDCSLPT